MTQTPRGFDEIEYQNRLSRAQALMSEAKIDALLLTTEPEVRYFTGFLTQFWESPTRPWFVVIPADAKPIAVIPTIGAEFMGKTWIDDIRTWQSPDLVDDGISLLADTLIECVGKTGTIGTPKSHETYIRMPQSDLEKLLAQISPARVIDDCGIMRNLRMTKSEAEISKIHHACTIATNAFKQVQNIAGPGVPLDEVFRKFQMVCLANGADAVPYLAGGAGQHGYGDVISPATSTKLQNGDVLMLDTGLVHDGYFCDFNRNYCIGKPEQSVTDGHARLLDAIAAGMDVAKSGATAADVYHAMMNVIDDSGDNSKGAGRFGHGLGMQLTEWPSLTAQDQTILKPGMVLTLEPVIPVGVGKIMVHEENIVVRENGPQLLTTLAKPQLPELQTI